MYYRVKQPYAATWTECGTLLCTRISAKSEMDFCQDLRKKRRKYKIGYKLQVSWNIIRDLLLNHQQALKEAETAYYQFLKFCKLKEVFLVSWTCLLTFGWCSRWFILCHQIVTERVWLWWNLTLRFFNADFFSIFDFSPSRHSYKATKIYAFTEASTPPDKHFDMGWECLETTTPFTVSSERWSGDISN